MPARTGAGGSPMMVDRRLSGSPPSVPLSKRDKRRNNITDRLSDMIDTFAQEQHQHYRAQLQAIQVDMSLILRANPYNNMPLDDDAEDIEHEVENITGGNLPQLSNEAAKKDYLALAGKRYHDYVQDINRAMEQRDADLTALKNRYDGAMAELERTTSYKIQVAQREHMELASTVRTRLITSVTKKRDKLLREKEQLDIADSSALFLNPSQFSMNIPGSPGGALNHRNTRFMRHRIANPDDASLERGRKRKAPQDDEATDSPAPAFRPLPNDNNNNNNNNNSNSNNNITGAASPFAEAREKTIYTQYEAPVFSIERLFTDKELAHATTIAQIAAHQFFHQQQPAPIVAEAAAAAAATMAGLAGLAQPTTNGHPAAQPMPLHGSADVTAASILASVAGGGDAAANGTPPPSQPQAPEMERTISHHATRNATRANPLAALSEAAALTSTNNFTPHLIPITRTDKGAPTPPGVDLGQADSDMALMFREDDPLPAAIANSSQLDEETSGHGQYPESSLRALRDRFLEQAVRYHTGNAPFRLPLTETGPSHINFLGGVARLPAYGYADPASMRFHMPNGGVPSSTTAVAAPALPLVNENLSAVLGDGAEAMSRSTSFAGSDAGAANGHGSSNTLANTNGDAVAGVEGAAMRRVRNRLI